MALKKQQQKNLETQDHFMQLAVQMSQYALDSKTGGPFGAIIVKQGKIIGSSGNRVFAECDPTAHAEVMAIRDACKNLESTDLSGCEIYSSGEPCPLCTAAIYWSKIETVYYSNTEKDAMEYGFIDEAILEELRKPKAKRAIKFKQLKNENAIGVFQRSLESY